MKITASIGNYGVLQAKLQQIQNVLFVAPANEIALGALDVQLEAKRSIADHQSSGKVVQLYNPRREHDVSEPGYAPNSDLGKLAQSVEMNFDPDTLTAVVGTNLEYGKFLELGTSKMEARPWLFPAFETHKESIKQRVQAALQAAIQAGGSDAG